MGVRDPLLDPPREIAAAAQRRLALRASCPPRSAFGWPLASCPAVSSIRYARGTIAGMSRETARKVLEIEAHAILGLVPRVDEAFDRAIEVLFGCAGRVVVSGMGKSGLIGQKISATLSSTGTPSLC